ncbi:MAG: hypothetical protein ACKVT1_14715 [Dehalococcoidia bacterium]
MERIETIEAPACAHDWRYYVDTQSKAVSARRCERCGERRVMARPAAQCEPAVPAR